MPLQSHEEALTMPLKSPFKKGLKKAFLKGPYPEKRACLRDAYRETIRSLKAFSMDPILLQGSYPFLMAFLKGNYRDPMFFRRLVFLNICTLKKKGRYSEIVTFFENLSRGSYY